jgi:hypothetical protein
MDRVNVLRALDKHDIHRDYLDKLFQCIVRIPLSKNYDSFISDITKKYFKEDTDKLSKMLADILEKNPRKVKNFLNSLRAYWEIAKKETPSLKIEILALFHYLRIYFERIFTILERNPNYIEQLYNVCKGNPSNEKVELLFYDYLKNPFVERVKVEPESKPSIKPYYESKIITPAKIEKEELDYMKEISPRYEALGKFKKYFFYYYQKFLIDQDNQTQHIEIIEKYLGIIEDE